MQLLLIAAWVLATGWAVVIIHELGHYLAGLAVDIPRREMRIQLGHSPHVALRQGPRWVAPDHPDYVQVFARHNPGLVAAWVFIAGGVALESTAVLIGAVLLYLASASQLAVLVLAVSTALLLAYAVIDVVTSRRVRHPCGDVTALWAIAPRWSAALLVVVGLRGLVAAVAAVALGPPG